MLTVPQLSAITEAIRARIVRCHCIANCSCCWTWPTDMRFAILKARGFDMVDVRAVIIGKGYLPTCGEPRCLRFKHHRRTAKHLTGTEAKARLKAMVELLLGTVTDIA